MASYCLRFHKQNTNNYVQMSITLNIKPYAEVIIEFKETFLYELCCLLCCVSIHSGMVLIDCFKIKMKYET